MLFDHGRDDTEVHLGGALRFVAEHNRVDVPGFGVLPCAGLYAAVVRTGTLRTGDELRVGGA